VANEFFDSRTKIEDTASTHMHFCKGKRSVYVQEKVSTGIAKINADYLCAMQRWAEGAVQLFWLQLFVDMTKQLVIFAAGVLCFLGMLCYALYGPWTQGIFHMNIFCDEEGKPTLLLGDSHPFCTNLVNVFSTFLGHTIDKVIFKMAAHDYFRLVDFAITWLLTILLVVALTTLLAWRGIMPRIVRVFIMMENISYWLTSCSIFFWTSLTLYMILGNDPPLMFNVTHFMLFVLAMNIANHCMINEYKHMGDCDELSIWRSQQTYTLAAPLYIMAIVRGTVAAWGIITKRLDKSFWTANEHGTDVIRAVTFWVTFIWVSFILCLGYMLSIKIHGWLFDEVGEKIQKQTQVGALLLLGLLAITVWEPILTLWGVDRHINRIAKGSGKEDEGNVYLSAVANFMVWWRGKVWIIRYLIDFGMPFLVLSGVFGGVSFITVATCLQHPGLPYIGGFSCSEFAACRISEGCSANDLVAGVFL